MRSGTYIGPDVGLNVTAGQEALLRASDKPGVVLAQFDDFSMQRNGVNLAYGWHEFPATDFQIKIVQSNSKDEQLKFRNL